MILSDFMTFKFNFKTIKLSLILSLLSLMAISLTIQSIDRIGTFTIINRVEHESMAQQYAQRYGLQLQTYSRFGVAVYKTHRYSHYQWLISSGLFFKEDTMRIDGFDGGTLTEDPLLSSQYALGFTGIAETWDFTLGHPDITIAIIDTGVDIDHPDLFHAMTETGFHARSLQEGLIYADDANGHGTRVAGVIAAAHNQLGIAGAAPNLKIMPIRASYETTSAFLTSDLINAVLFAIEQEVDIINMSLTTSSYHALFEEVCVEADAAGILVIAASGNSGKQQYLYPAAFPSVFAIGSVSDSLTKSFFSTYHDRVDALAPGHNIYTSARGGYDDIASGTSFAAPYASAMAGLLWSMDLTLTLSELKQRLIDSAMDLYTPGKDEFSGYGVLNIRRAIERLSATETFSSATYEMNLVDEPLPMITTTEVNVSLANLDWGISLDSDYPISVSGNTFGSVNNPLNEVYFRSELYQPNLSLRTGILDVSVTLSGLSEASMGSIEVYVGPHALFSPTSWIGGTAQQRLTFTLNRMLFGHVEIRFTNLTEGFHLEKIMIYSVGVTITEKLLDFAQAIEPLDTCDPTTSLTSLRTDYANFTSYELELLQSIWLDDYVDASRTTIEKNVVDAHAKWLRMSAINP